MGQRANHVVVEDGKWALYYSHWAASTADADLFWGPAHALEFVRAQEPTGEWLDEVWCEGGALVDMEKSVLLWFGGEDVWEMPRHRLLLSLMRRVWRGWTVRWAFEGLGDLADHLGVSRDLVRSGRRSHSVPPLDDFLCDLESADSVVSLERDGQVSVHGIRDAPHELFLRSPDLVDFLASRASPPGPPAVIVKLHGDRAVRGGAHIDPARRRVDIWETDYRQDLAIDAARSWPGWQFAHHGDRFESQLERAGGALQFVLPSQGRVLEELSARLLGTKTFDPNELLATFQKEHEGRDVQVNPHFLSYAPHRLSVEARARILSEATAGVPLLPGFVP
jgi:hypothetical protein